MRMLHFHHAQFGESKNLFRKTINIIFKYLLATFIVENFKKFLSVDPELWGCLIIGPKMLNLPKEEFFQKNH